jgi:AcrR family transcriptional regulator
MNSDRGRPRSFDTENALDRALEVFWRNGYQGSSLSELTAAMGISKPSLYAAYGDKESLYLKALARYASLGSTGTNFILESEPDAWRAVEAYLRGTAAALTDSARPGGCFIVNGSADCGASATPPAVESALRSALRQGEERLKSRLQRAKVDGQLPKNTTVPKLALFFNSLIVGMGVLAKGGAKRAQLDAVITTAMRVWPTGKRRARARVKP